MMGGHVGLCSTPAHTGLRLFEAVFLKSTSDGLHKSAKAVAECVCTGSVLD